jgi:nicotinamide-nucleotide amidase
MSSRYIIITQGDELTTGSILDRNSQWLAAQITDKGHSVCGIHTLPDNRELLSQFYRKVSLEYDVVISTGGLGPTDDDHSRFAFAEAFSLTLRPNQTATNHLVEYCKNRSRPLTEDIKKMSLLPSESSIIPNPLGSALGFTHQIKACTFHFLPGVPQEMKAMFGLVFSEEQRKTKRLKTFLCFGCPESELEKRLKPLGIVGNIGFQATRKGNIVKVQRDTLTNNRLTQIRAQLKDCLVDEDETDMAVTLSTLLTQTKGTVSTAESCTAGQVSAWLASISGASSYFKEGVVTYSNKAKEKYCHVKTESLLQYGAVSEAVAREMAEGIRKKSGSTWGLSVSGIAGPGGGTEMKPVGTVHISVASQSKTRHEHLKLNGNRTQITASAAAHVLWLLCKAIREENKIEEL